MTRASPEEQVRDLEIDLAEVNNSQKETVRRLAEVVERNHDLKEYAEAVKGDCRRNRDEGRQIV